MSEKKTETVYHYTDRESAKKIIQSGYIRQSDPKDGDAIAGKGTYATTLRPSESKDAILKNNYDGMRPIDERKADVAFELKVDKARIETVKSDRDVRKVEGNIELDRDTKIHVRGTGKTYKFSK